MVNMRLIDADAIEYEQIMDPMGNGMYSHANHVYEGDIDAMPTVDAIPVSFIFDRMRTINSEYINIQRLIDTEPETAVRRIGIATNLLCEYKTLRDLIQAWKERREE